MFQFLSLVSASSCGELWICAIESPSVAVCRFLQLPPTIQHHSFWACEDCKQDVPHLWPREGLLEVDYLNLLLDYTAVATPCNCARSTKAQQLTPPHASSAFREAFHWPSQHYMAFLTHLKIVFSLKPLTHHS